jgi:hypothetical protein
MKTVSFLTFVVSDEDNSGPVRMPASAIPNYEPPSQYVYLLHGVSTIRSIMPQVSSELSMGSDLYPVDIQIQSHVRPSDRVGLEGEAPLLEDCNILSLLRVRDDLRIYINQLWAKKVALLGLPEEPNFPRKPTQHPHLVAWLLRHKVFANIEAVIIPTIFGNKQVSIVAMKKNAAFQFDADPSVIARVSNKF